MHNQPDIKEKDIMNASAGAFNALTGEPADVRQRMTEEMLARYRSDLLVQRIRPAPFPVSVATFRPSMPVRKLEPESGQVYTQARYALYPPVRDSGRSGVEERGSLGWNVLRLAEKLAVRFDPAGAEMTSCTAEEAPSLSLAGLVKVWDDLEARRPKVHYWMSDTVPAETEDPDTGKVALAVWTLDRFWRWAYLVDDRPVVVLHPDNEDAFLRACQAAGIKALRAGVVNDRVSWRDLPGADEGEK